MPPPPLCEADISMLPRGRDPAPSSLFPPCEPVPLKAGSEGARAIPVKALAASTKEEKVGSDDESGCFFGGERRDADRVRGLELVRCGAGIGSEYSSLAACASARPGWAEAWPFEVAYTARLSQPCSY